MMRQELFRPEAQSYYFEIIYILPSFRRITEINFIIRANFSGANQKTLIKMSRNKLTLNFVVFLYTSI